MTVVRAESLRRQAPFGRVVGATVLCAFGAVIYPGCSSDKGTASVGEADVGVATDPGRTDGPRDATESEGADDDIGALISANPDSSDVRPDTVDAQSRDRCRCASDGAACVWHPMLDWWCAFPEPSCEDDSECPAGFQCGSKDICWCDGDRTQCGPFCEDHSECPESSICDPGLGVCVAAPICDGDVGCRDGFWCIDDACAGAGVLEPGSPCSDDRECQSGWCGNGACGQRCFADDDCPDGEECGYGDPFICAQPGAQTACATECGPDTICNGEDCLPPACIRSADCSSGDCLVFVPWQDAGWCTVGEPNRCKPHEFLAEFYDSGELVMLCAVAPDCGGFDDRCADPYQCRRVGSPHVSVTYCARTPD